MPFYFAQVDEKQWDSQFSEQWQLPVLFYLVQVDEKQWDSQFSEDSFYEHQTSHFQAQNRCFGMDTAQTIEGGHVMLIQMVHAQCVPTQEPMSRLDRKREEGGREEGWGGQGRGRREGGEGEEGGREGSEGEGENGREGLTC